MANYPVAIMCKPTRGGTEVIAIGRSDRGTRFFKDSIVVLHAGADAEGIKRGVAEAARELLPALRVINQ